MVENTQFLVEVLARDTSYSERNFIVAFDYHWNDDKVKREIIPYQGYIYVGLGCYDLKVVERLQNKKIGAFKEVFERKWS